MRPADPARHRLPYNAFLPDDVKIAQVATSARAPGPPLQLDLAVWGDVKETLRCLTPRVNPKGGCVLPRQDAEEARGRARGCRQGVHAQVEKHVPIHPEYVASVLDELADEDAVFTIDTGMCNVWAARYIFTNGRRRVIGSFSHGSMANALPMAIGAQFTEQRQGRLDVRRRRVRHADGRLPHPRPVRPAGEGHPLQQLRPEHGRVGDAGRRAALVRDHGRNPDFGAVARACGAYGVRVEKPKDLTGALKAAFKHKGPALVDVVTDPNALSIPPKISAEMVTGFALSASKMVLDGGVGRMVQIAASNLRNVPRP